MLLLLRLRSSLAVSVESARTGTAEIPLLIEYGGYRLACFSCGCYVDKYVHALWPDGRQAVYSVHCMKIEGPMGIKGQVQSWRCLIRRSHALGEKDTTTVDSK